MRHIARRHLYEMIFVSLALVALASACRHTPPNLSPAGSLAWKQHEIQKNLDLIRDIAQDGSNVTPTVVSVDDARKITEWHRSAIIVIHDAAAGWLATLTSGLQQLKANLSAAAQQKFGPYIDLAVGVVKGFTS